MQAACILTGYNDISLALVNPPTPEQNVPNVLSTLLEKYIDTTQWDYDDVDTIKTLDETPMGLQCSPLLCHLPWLTPWADIFQTFEPGMVDLQLNWKIETCANHRIETDRHIAGGLSKVSVCHR